MSNASHPTYCPLPTKQRSNQWSCPPFILLEKVLPSRYTIGLDPATEGSKNKVLVLIALDPERVEDNNPDFMISSVNSSVNSRNAEDPPLTCALPPNIMDFLTFVDSSRL